MASRSKLGKKLSGSLRSVSRLSATSLRASGGYPLNCSGLRSRGNMELQQLRDGPTLGQPGGKAHDAADRGDEVCGFHRAVVNDAFADTSAESHHPGGAGHSVAGAVVLEAVTSRVFVRIATEVGKDEKRSLLGVFGLGLNGSPKLGTQAVGAANPFDIEREGAGVSNVDVVHGDPEQARSNLTHELA